MKTLTELRTNALLLPDFEVNALSSLDGQTLSKGALSTGIAAEQLKSFCARSCGKREPVDRQNLREQDFLTMKRGTEDVPPDDPNKRPRTDGAPAAPGKPSLSLDALEKAKKALQLQKDLKEKLKKLPQPAAQQAPCMQKEHCKSCAS
eukprot:1057765-Pelagomonas_calceolata.AAC.2